MFEYVPFLLPSLPSLTDLPSPDVFLCSLRFLFCVVCFQRLTPYVFLTFVSSLLWFSFFILIGLFQDHFVHRNDVVNTTDVKNNVRISTFN